MLEIEGEGLVLQPSGQDFASNAGGEGSIPGWEAKILHASEPKTKAENRSSIVTHSINTLKIILKQKLRKKRKEIEGEDWD